MPVVFSESSLYNFSIRQNAVRRENSNTDYGGNSMFCKYCGNRLEDGDRFCGACGHPVEEKPMQETANEDSYKKQEEKVPRIKKKKPEPEFLVLEEFCPQ